MRTAECHQCGETNMLVGRACMYDNKYFCSRDCENNYYIETLADINRDTDPRVMAVCRAWHDENFAMPGYGGLGFVREELSRAAKAVKVLRSFEE